MKNDANLSQTNLMEKLLSGTEAYLSGVMERLSAAAIIMVISYYEVINFFLLRFKYLNKDIQNLNRGDVFKKTTGTYSVYFIIRQIWVFPPMAPFLEVQSIHEEYTSIFCMNAADIKEYERVNRKTEIAWILNSWRPKINYNNTAIPYISLSDSGFISSAISNLFLATCWVLVLLAETAVCYLLIDSFLSSYFHFGFDAEKIVKGILTIGIALFNCWIFNEHLSIQENSERSKLRLVISEKRKIIETLSYILFIGCYVILDFKSLNQNSSELPYLVLISWLYGFICFPILFTAGFRMKELILRAKKEGTAKSL